MLLDDALPVDGSRLASQQDRVYLVLLIQLVLEICTRHEGIASRLGTGTQREARHAFVGQNSLDGHFQRLQNVVGLMLNTLIMRVDQAPSTRKSAFIEHVRGVVVSALEHKDVPVEIIQKALGATADQRLFGVRYVYRRIRAKKDASESMEGVTSIEVPRKDAKFDIRHPPHQRLERLPDAKQRPNILRAADPAEHRLRRIAPDRRSPLIELIELRRIGHHVHIGVAAARIFGDVWVFADHGVRGRKNGIEILPARCLKRRQP